MNTVLPARLSPVTPSRTTGSRKASDTVAPAASIPRDTVSASAERTMATTLSAPGT